MDKYLKAVDVSPQHLASLREWAEAHKPEALRGAVMLLCADLTDGKNVTMACETTEGFRNPETATVARVIDNHSCYQEDCSRIVIATRSHIDPLSSLAFKVEEYVRRVFSGTELREIGSLWRVDWREIAEHVMCE